MIRDSLSLFIILSVFGFESVTPIRRFISSESVESRRTGRPSQYVTDRRREITCASVQRPRYENLSET